jgi:hypothetical protein
MLRCPSVLLAVYNRCQHVLALQHIHPFTNSSPKEFLHSLQNPNLQASLCNYILYTVTEKKIEMLDSDCTKISPAMRLLYVFFNFMPHAPNLLAHGKQGLDLAHVRPDRLPLSPRIQPSS